MCAQEKGRFAGLRNIVKRIADRRAELLRDKWKVKEVKGDAGLDIAYKKLRDLEHELLEEFEAPEHIRGYISLSTNYDNDILKSGPVQFKWVGLKVPPSAVFVVFRLRDMEECASEYGLSDDDAFFLNNGWKRWQDPRRYQDGYTEADLDDRITEYLCWYARCSPKPIYQ